MADRAHAGGTNENSTYSFYCRQCGNVMKALLCPHLCTVCGNTLIDTGFGTSGDTTGDLAGDESGSADKAPWIPLRITNIDRKLG